MGAVYALVDGTVTWTGGESPVYRGECWDSSSPVVRERPELFTPLPLAVI